MSKTFRTLSLLILGLLTITACDEASKSRTLPRHSGEAGEVLLVMDEKKWLGPEGDSLRLVLEKFVQQLPQSEAMFDLLQFSPREMSNLLKQHRNIIKIEIGPEVGKKNKVTLSQDKWSSDQLVFTAYAENQDEWNDLLKTEFPRVADLINDKEVSRLQKNYRRNGNEDLEKQVQKKFGISMLLPLDTEIAVEKENFMWVKRERVKYLGNTPHDITQGIFVYRYPYKGEDDFRQEQLLSVRDSVLQLYVPGPQEGTYMSTEYRYPPESRDITIDGQFGTYTQGLWRTENYFMGGPFRRIATTSQDGNYMLVVSGFAFSPKFDKREYVRELDAIISSVKFP